jgi:hypothetical protein
MNPTGRPEHAYSHIPSLASAYASSPEDTELYHQVSRRLSQTHPHPVSFPSPAQTRDHGSQYQDQQYGYQQHGSEQRPPQTPGYAPQYVYAPMSGHDHEEHLKAHAMAYGYISSSSLPPLSPTLLFILLVVYFCFSLSVSPPSFRPNAHTHDTPMVSHTIGQAAAVEALHMSAQQQTPHDAGAAKDGAKPQDKLVCHFLRCVYGLRRVEY